MIAASPLSAADCLRLLRPEGRLEEAVDMVVNLDNVVARLPQAEAPGVVQALREFLIDHPRAFHQAYERLSAPALAGGPAAHAGAHEPVIADAVAQMRDKGAAYLPGFFAGEVEALREASIEPLGKAKAFLRKGRASSDGQPFFDEAMGCEYWGKPSTADFGRFRAFFRNGLGRHPEPIARHMHDPVMHEIGRRYFQAPVSNGGVLCEFLEPAPATGDFHVDTIKDQFKVMVLLDDVKEENGAMRVKPGTHRLWRSELRPMLHNIFAYGNDWCGVSEPRWQTLPQKTVTCTGRAGDAWIFDTMGLHTAAQCTEGYRLVAVSYYGVGGRKNAILHALGVR